jgi:hypothetical protein
MRARGIATAVLPALLGAGLGLMAPVGAEATEVVDPDMPDGSPLAAVMAPVRLVADVADADCDMSVPLTRTKLMEELVSTLVALSTAIGGTTMVGLADTATLVLMAVPLTW